MCFVDLEDTYDRVPQGNFWELLLEYGFLVPLLCAIWSLYNQSERCVCIFSRKSNTFLVGIGLRQGFPLSQILFVIFMNRTLRFSHGEEDVQFWGIRIASLLFVDDVVLLTSSDHDHPKCDVARMRIKSEAIIFSWKTLDCPLLVGMEFLPQVKEFKNLRVLFTSHGRMEWEIDRPISVVSVIKQAIYQTCCCSSASKKASGGCSRI